MALDVAVVGAGPAGYTLAIRLGQLGLRVMVVERERVGGTCLNWGCIPTKALYHATESIERANAAAARGIRFSPPTVDIDALRGSTQAIVAELRNGVESLLDATEVTRRSGHGQLTATGGLTVDGEPVGAERVVLAAGSVPIEIPFVPFAENTVWSSDDAVSLPEVPKRLVIIGAGVIGLEMACIYRRLGSEVVVLEMMDRLLPGIELDRRFLAVLSRALAQRGIVVRLGDAAARFELRGSLGVITTQSGETIEGERILVAVGRRPRTADLGLDVAGVAVGAGGRIDVNESFETSVSGLFAIGDLIPGPMLAHKASAEAVALAEALGGGQALPIDHEMIPQAVFTDPEVACVGLSEATARDRVGDVIVGRVPYAAMGKAQAMGATDGAFQVIAERSSGRLLGVQVVGAGASDVISGAALALHAGLTVHDLADAVQVHPTLPEGLKEAAEAALGKAIHIQNRPQRR